MDEFTMLEIVDETGIGARTIRRYIQLGLVPRPRFRGRATTYSRMHLARIRAASQLIERLSVAEIRAKLATMTLDELERRFGPIDYRRQHEVAELSFEAEAAESTAWEERELARWEEQEREAAREEQTERDGRGEEYEPPRYRSELAAPKNRWSAVSLGPGLALVISDNASKAARRVADRIVSSYAPEIRPWAHKWTPPATGESPSSPPL